MKSLHGPILMWHHISDINTSTYFNTPSQTWTHTENTACLKSGQRPDSIQVTSFSNKTDVNKKRMDVVWQHWQRLNPWCWCNIQRRCRSMSASSWLFILLQRRSLCGNHDPWVHVLNEWDWEKMSLKTFEAQKVTNSTKNFVKFSVAQLWVYKKTYCAHLCNTPPRASLPAATQHSSCLLGTEGPCKL